MAHIKNLTQLRAAGGVVSREPEKVEVEWEHDGDTDTIDVWVVKPGLGKMLKLRDVKDKEQVSATLSECVLLEDDKGKLVPLTYDIASQLDPMLGIAILNAIGSDRTKNSQQPTNSSANLSQTESAVAPSQTP